ncbi:MAG: CDP-alcohol phosphatidyltransferase family protein [Planctomycetota bacterium]
MTRGGWRWWCAAAVTLGNLVCGFVAAWLALRAARGDGGVAWLAAVSGWVGLGVVLDQIDGPLARRWGVSSEAGKRLDGLADAVTFGAAPGLALAAAGGVWVWWGVAYAAAVWLRLGRVSMETSDAGAYFRGLPCPAAAMAAVGLAWFVAEPGRGPAWLGMLGAAGLCAWLVWVGVRFPRWGGIRASLGWRVFVVVGLAYAGVVAVRVGPPAGMGVAGWLYVAGGVAGWVRGALRRRSLRRSGHDGLGGGDGHLARAGRG